MRFATVSMNSVGGVNVCGDRHVVADAKHNAPVLRGSQVAKEPLELGEVINIDTMYSSSEKGNRSQAFWPYPLRQVQHLCDKGSKELSIFVRNSWSIPWVE
jgi:hypothetical protein